MRSFTEEAILLEVADLQEADRIVVFLTREHGKRRGAARGAKRKFSRFAGQLQPLAKVKIGWFEKEGRDLVRIASLELIRPAKELGSDLEGILTGAYLGESVSTFAQEGEASDKLYRLLDSVLAALEAGAERSLALRYFESWLLRLAGVFPPPDDCPVCGRPLGLPETGAALAASGEALLCRRCAGENPGSLRVSSAALEFWRRIGRESLTAMAKGAGGAEGPFAFDRRTLDEVEEVAGRIRRHFLQGEIRSYQVARRTLSSLDKSSTSARSFEADTR